MHLSLSLLGPLKPEITIAYVAVSLIFFNSGLSLKTEVGNCRSHQMLVLRDTWYITMTEADWCEWLKSWLPPSVGADQCVASRSPPPVRSVFHSDLLPACRLAAAQSARTDRHRPVAAQRVRWVCVCVTYSVTQVYHFLPKIKVIFKFAEKIQIHLKLK